MPNDVTGGYDVALQIPAATINGLLRSAHARNLLPHSAQLALRDVTYPGDPLPAAQRTGVVATVSAQIAPPTVGLAGPRNQITLTFPVRTQFGQSSGVPVPPLARGAVQLTTQAAFVSSGSSVSFDLPGALAAAHASFAPAAGSPTVDPAEAQHALDAMLNAFRGGLFATPGPVEITGPGIFTPGFKLLDGTLTALANLSAVSPPSDMSHVTQTLATGGGADLFLSISSEYVQQRVLAEIRSLSTPWSMDIPLPGLGSLMLGNLHVAVDPSSVAVQLHAGGPIAPGGPVAPASVLATLQGTSTASGLLSLIGLNFSFEVTVPLVPSVSHGNIVFTVGEPLFTILHADPGANALRPLITSRVSAELDSLRSMVPPVTFPSSLLTDIVVAELPGVAVTPQAVQIEADLITLTANVMDSLRPSPAVVFSSRYIAATNEVELDGSASWMPGGEVLRMLWQGATATVNTDTYGDYDHLLIRVPAPDGANSTRWCERLECRSAAIGGADQSRNATGAACTVALPSAPFQRFLLHIADNAAVRFPPPNPVGPDPVEEITINLQRVTRRAPNGVNTLVLAGDAAPNIGAVAKAASGLKLDGRPLTVLSVSSAADLPAVPAAARNLSFGVLAGTANVDPDAGILLIAPRGGTAWTMPTANFNADALAEQLDKTLQPCSPLEQLAPALTVAPGMLLPDAPFQLALPALQDPKLAGETVTASLPRLGAAATICLWDADVQASVTELTAVVQTQDAGSALIVGLHVGANTAAAQTAFAKLGSSGALLGTDAQGSVAATLGVFTTPITITADAAGRVESIAIGPTVTPPAPKN